MARQDRHIESLAQAFRILGDPTRLRVVTVLREGHMNVSQLCRLLDMPQPSVSHHLGLLRMGGLVDTRRRGKEVFYSLSETAGGRHMQALEAIRGELSPSGQAVRIGPFLVRAAEA